MKPHGPTTGQRHIILVATDDRFARPAGVTLRSAYDNCRNTELGAVVLDCGLSEDSRSFLKSAWSGELDFRVFDPEPFKGFAVKGARAALARLGLEHYLEEKRARVLYLDSDVLVRGSLDPLLDVDLQGFTLGAVAILARATLGQSPKPWSQAVYVAGGAAPGGMNFNSGVLLIDLDRWKQRSVMQRASELGKRYPAADQALLNSLLSRDWLPLPAKWNTKAPDAVIYHFASEPRPWQRNYYRNPIWLEYLRVADSLGWHIDRPSFLRTRIAARSIASRARAKLGG